MIVSSNFCKWNDNNYLTINYLSSVNFFNEVNALNLHSSLNYKQRSNQICISNRDTKYYGQFGHTYIEPWQVKLIHFIFLQIFWPKFEISSDIYISQADDDMQKHKQKCKVNQNQTVSRFSSRRLGRILLKSPKPSGSRSLQLLTTTITNLPDDTITCSVSTITRFSNRK